MGLNPDEDAFFREALAEKPELLLDMGDATLKKLAHELPEKLRNSTTWIGPSGANFQPFPLMSGKLELPL